MWIDNGADRRSRRYVASTLRRKTRERAAKMMLLFVCLCGGLVFTGVSGSRAGPSSASQFIQDTIRHNDIVIFTKADCPFCRMTKEVFSSLHYQYLDVDLDLWADAGDLQTALWVLTGARTVPQVFVRGRYIGGGAQVLAWYRNGHLFSRKVAEESTTTEPVNERQLAFTKLINSSRNAIKWINNKTSGPLNGWLRIKNQTDESMVSESPGTAGTQPFLSWLRGAVKGKFHFNSSPSFEGDSSESEEDSGEDLVIAHRDKDGFSWGPPASNSTLEVLSSNGTNGLLNAAKHRVQHIFMFVYKGAKSITDRSKQVIKYGLTKVFAKKDPFLMKQYATETIEQELQELEKRNGTIGVDDIAFACDDSIKPICAVDLVKHYTIFQNECKMVLFNYRHRTNFSRYDNDICISLFARHPELFYQNIDKEEKKAL